MEQIETTERPDDTGDDMPAYLGTATYSPDDNKLRFYPRHRLDAAEYERAKAAGFRWAPKQELFVAPAWTPGREDLLLEWCGEIEDEDKSLVARAEERAERFEDYSEKRSQDADRAHSTVAGIVEHIPLGQPILIGHHSERRARKDAERIRSGMQKAVKMWETSKYWRSRAAGALAHAKYKELPAVRARRIKGIESDQRKAQAGHDDAQARLKLWTADGLTREKALLFANGGSYSSYCFPLAKYPRGPEVSQYEGPVSLWSALDGGIIDHMQARDLIVPRLEYTIKRARRWLDHYANRLEYERAMLQEQGGLITDRFAVEVGGMVLCGREWLTVVRVNRSEGRIVSVTTNGKYGRVRGIEEVTDYQPPAEGAVEAVKAATKLPPLCNYDGEGFRHMTKAEFDRFKRAGSAYTRVQAGDETRGAHRVRVVMGGSYIRTQIFVTDIPVKMPPAPSDPKPSTRDLPRTGNPDPMPPTTPRATDPRDDLFAGMKQAAKAGVQVVTAPQLFPTPEDLARKMVEYVAGSMGGMAGCRVLEPSAGTGNLVRAIQNSAVGADNCRVYAVEINPSLCQALEDRRSKTLGANIATFDIRCADFLDVDPADIPACHYVVMNPPFANGADIKHIRHALRFLKPGGKLVAICANGPRQRAELMPEATHWEDLPAGTFKEQGTNVNTALLVMER